MNQQRAFNNPPTYTPTGARGGRLARSGREPEAPTRCNFLIEGEPCNAFPSWWVPGSKGRQRRCEKHRGQ